MHTINIPQMKQLVSLIAIAHTEPVMIWGKPGCGKSEGIAQVADEAQLTLVDIRTSQYDSVDFRGVPTIDRRTTVWNLPATLPFKGNPEFEEGGSMYNPNGYLLFLDEINSGTPPVQAVCYQLINDYRVGEHELMDNVRVVAAGNREGDRGVTNRMPTPLANRFTHAEVTVDPDAWCFWAQEAGLPPIFVAFIQFRKPLLDRFEEDGLKHGKKAFATPRTWVKAAKYFADPTMPVEIKQAGMAGAVGEGPAAEFWGFHDVWSKMIPLSVIEKDPTGVALPDEASMRYAMTIAISGAMDNKNIPQFHKFLMRLSPEFAILAWQLAMQRDPAITSTKEFIDFAKKYRQVFARS